MLEQLSLLNNPPMGSRLLSVSEKKKAPFDYQTKVIEEIHAAIADGKQSITLAASTGFGKTIVAVHLKQDFVALGKKILLLVHRDILIKQTLEALAEFGLTAGVIAGGYPENRFDPIQVASIQTLARRDISWFRWDVSIFDEAHVTAFGTWGKRTLNNLGDRKAILLTATPFRLSKRESFSQISDHLVKPPSLLELIQMGRLAKPRYLVAGEIDTSEARTSRGDFRTDDLSVLCDNSEVLDRFCEAIHTHAKGRLGLAFSVGINHAKSIATAINNSGLNAAYVSGEMSRKERQELYAALANRELDWLASCEALAEGFNVPNIDCIGLLRPTKSKAKYIQQIGRGLRFFPDKKDALIICQSGNVKRFGFAEEIAIEFDSFEDKSPAPAPTKTCGLWDEDLNYWVSGVGCRSEVHASLMTCPHCGYEFPSKDEEKIRFIGEFKELLPTWQKKYFEQYCDLLDKCLDRGWHPYKAIAEYKEKHPKNYNPSNAWNPLWVKARDVSAEQIYNWLQLVSSRKKDKSIIKKYSPKFLSKEKAAECILFRYSNGEQWWEESA